MISKLNCNDIYFVEQFQTNSNRTIAIDFNNPEKAQNELIKIMEEVEAECPIGKAFGVSGTGEGVVISHLTEDGSLIQAKVKGELTQKVLERLKLQ